ncbi:hypothetical protein VEE56_16440 [Escherichia coli]|nr:hypothetical protein VEE56_16440 [Escherichia coli]
MHIIYNGNILITLSFIKENTVLCLLVQDNIITNPLMQKKKYTAKSPKTLKLKTLKIIRFL